MSAIKIKIKYKVQYLQLIYLQSSQRILYLFPIVQFEIISLSQLLSHLLFSTLQTFYNKNKNKSKREVSCLAAFVEAKQYISWKTNYRLRTQKGDGFYLLIRNSYFYTNYIEVSHVHFLPESIYLFLLPKLLILFFITKIHLFWNWTDIVKINN